ncbi:hemerythrin domain-containing protein [Candidatus Protochlamydia phocaeensis]|uniref:hemerythrin domain-containing protein n=1 Tax=Candidatus Protochlamydia phocaeensis TaxID=1414722 RepID=UPI000B1DD30E|nr:hemerythrin domain-containing protein [Candidatus Protochlamydia phocaeensis]
MGKKGFALISVLTASLFTFSGLSADPFSGKQEEEVSPNEDLMREHGILNRLLLIYQEIAKRIEHKQEFPIDALANSAKIVRNFLEDYHEKLEEEYIFPRFEKTHQLADLVKTLKDQHDAGRQLTDYILSHANEQMLKDEEQKHLLAHYLRLYIRMFRPHEAREDTVLFPAFRKLLSQDEYDKLGDKFEEREHRLFGENGFEKTVDQLAEIEKQLNIYNLSQFTPNLKRNKEASYESKSK